ncbi:hypothetical protein AAG570_000044 [Ranatra chinensis]|uniref:DM10 domain-containing protein n=1 Tax=Ranatra chinensis TaxID=642074 RepID=A0ABD0Z6F3_9HEMI
MAGGQLMLRRKMLKPGEDIYSRKAPATYTYQDMFIGNLLLLEGFTFQLVWPDDYALGYMELHPDQFPMSNPQLVMSKFRECVKPVYKQFVARFISTTKLIYTKFRDAIRDVMGDKITDQEILTLARRYATPLEKCQLPQESLRRLAQDMLRRELYDDFERLRESFLYKDPGKAGTVTRRSAYSTLLAARLPIHLDLINIILDTLAEIDGKNEKFVNYDRLLHFFNYKDNPSTPIAPINIGKNMSWLAVGRPQQMGPPECMKVDISALVDDLHLEEELKEQSQ